MPFNRSYVWGSNADLANRALLLALAYDFSGEARYRDEVINAMDYMLGRNPLDQSYVSGYGARPMTNPHHRFWAPSRDSALPPPPPGVLAGGSNFNRPADSVAERIYPQCHAQTCYADDIEAYSLNEVAINWNAPFFWIAAFLAEPIAAD
ncbi:MAG: glycoside hydrolase family 9 protein [Terricaulis sp.]|nr:glycoside hydrolase family 9 protein [Terricaulis sp.]